ncbi:MAG: anhydro-N-acetylmuramic acid kinase [Alphaproteobacteria bacterium]|nr:anhydro-N-acetylmuramic acid kinase [Alphaproteobacteria bacterium]
MNIIGIMTGNSLDACDIVLTRFSEESMTDLSAASFPISKKLQQDILILKKRIQAKEIVLEHITKDSFFISVHEQYIKWIASSVKAFLQKYGYDLKDIHAIGFHGQTLDHNPPSVAISLKDVYTLQMGSGDLLSDLTGIPVISDFRSDDIMNEGEGAPLIPPHNEHFAKMLGLENCIFYNAGNTSNLAVIQNKKVIQGFDAGPFNEFSDYLVRLYKNDSFDKETKWGVQGQLDINLLEALFNQGAILKNKENFFLLPSPKSADPSLYGFKQTLHPQSEEEFYSMLHTVQYFAGYIAAYSLKYVETPILPDTFVLFGGGWKNKVSLKSFGDLLQGQGYILEAHQKDFEKIRSRFVKTPTFLQPEGAAYMEARLMADLAYSFERGKCWTSENLTGIKKLVVLGRKSLPQKSREAYTDLVSRANKGWQGL